VCTECGVVLEENAIVSAVEFVEGAGGASSMVGQFVSATSSKAYTECRAYGFSRDSRETTLANGRRKIPLGTCFLKFRRLLGLPLELVDPALYIYRFCAHLDLDDQANAVALTALRLVGRMKRDWIVTGRRPAGICAAALLIASRAHGFGKSTQDVTQILRICGLTVQNRVQEFEATASANLTLEQFNKVELESEADPPIYKRNKLLEARARAIQQQDTKLLESGQLDDPMLKSIKAKQKWRTTLEKPKDKEVQKLYEEIEAEMDEEKKEENEAPNGSEDNGKRRPLEDSSDPEKPSKVQKTSGSSCVVIANNQITTIPKKWERAYPRSRLGKAIILPEDSTAEEREPSAMPTEGVLDCKLWKDHLPKKTVEEVDSIFRSPKEIAQKEAIFNKINKNYMELQARREQFRHQSVEAQKEQDLELEEQAQGQERLYRKRNKGSKKTNATTEEALLEAVANRKISRKINYDAMSAIFDDDGTFSTGGPGEEEAVIGPEF